MRISIRHEAHGMFAEFMIWQKWNRTNFEVDVAQDLLVF